MQVPLQITYHNMEPSPAIESDIREKVDKLEEFSDKITSCRVTVEAPHKHHHKGYLYQVMIDLLVPDSEIVVSRTPRDNRSHEDIYVAIRDAFNSARRQLEDYERRRRGQVKTHKPVAGEQP